MNNLQTSIFQNEFVAFCQISGPPMVSPWRWWLAFALRQTNDHSPVNPDKSKDPVNECGWYKLDNYYNRWN